MGSEITTFVILDLGGDFVEFVFFFFLCLVSLSLFFRGGSWDWSAACDWSFSADLMVERWILSVRIVAFSSMFLNVVTHVVDYVH